MAIKSIVIKLIAILIIFIVGFSTASFIENTSIEIPKGAPHYKSTNSPIDRISKKDIEIYNDRVVIWVSNATLSEYADTGSMRPLIDKGANGIRIVPKREDDIKAGDIVTFESEYGIIVHRVIETGEDEQGKYFVTKGDNNLFSDGKIRFNQIKYVTIAVLY